MLPWSIYWRLQHTHTITTFSRWGWQRQRLFTYCDSDTWHHSLTEEYQFSLIIAPHRSKTDKRKFYINYYARYIEFCNCGSSIDTSFTIDLNRYDDFEAMKRALLFFLEQQNQYEIHFHTKLVYCGVRRVTG